MATLKLTKKYDRYPKYKDSGVEWVGETPVDWEIGRVKQYFKRMERPVVLNSEVVTAFRDGTVTLRSNRREDGFTMSDKEIGYQGIEKGDLVVHAMDAFAGAIGVSDSDGKSTPVYSALRSLGDTDERYYMYLLRHMSKSQYIFALAKGIRERSTEFRYKELAGLVVPKPPLELQKKMAGYLDEKLLLIDAIVEKKKKQIELLREKRAAIINRAVTKGLPARRSLGEGGDPNAKLIDSGIEWIGKIPEGWEVKKLKYVAQVEGGYAFSSDSYTSDSVTGVLLVRITEVKEQIAEECRRYVPSDLWDTLKTFRVQQGDILITLTGYVGETSMFPLQEKALLNQRAGKIQSSPNIHPKFLYYCTKPDAFRTFLSLRSKSSAQENVSNSDIGEFVLPFPPKREQQEIAEHIEEQCEKYLRAQDMLERSVALLQEFKSALISHVVTGKVKV